MTQESNGWPRTAALRITQLENIVRQQGHALEMLGIKFCAHCGKPHARPRQPEAVDTFINVKVENCGTVEILPVCMDDPTSARCYLAILNRKVETIDGLESLKCVDLASDLAKWVLHTRSYLPEAAYNGFIQSVMAGESTIESEEFAFHLAFWKNAPYSGVGARVSVRELIEQCGWSMDDEEHDSLIKKCLAFAIEHRATSQVAYFSRALEKSPKPEVTGMFSGLLA